jgi:DNA-binding NtrC family response regulator
MTEKLKILIIDDEEIIHETLGDYLESAKHKVDHAYNGKQALEEISHGEYDLALLDQRMPQMNGVEIFKQIQQTNPDLAVVIITGHGNMELAVQALRLGALDFLNKPIKLLELDAVIEKIGRIQSLKLESQRLRKTVGYLQTHEDKTYNLVGESSHTRHVVKQIHRAVHAQCDTILIYGETGTGKEVVARQLHQIAADSESPFIAVSCPALPENLIESELFGHQKGAFTGAVEDRAGCFELANGGTLFLDEIADLSASAQAKMLRVLETRSVKRVGSAKERHVDVRVVAASNVTLQDLVSKGSFRQDLYYRLNVFTINLLPLRERPDDIVPLAKHFLQNWASQRQMALTGFSSQALDALKQYNYPGNARELRNIVERAAILRSKGQIQTEDLNLNILTYEPAESPIESSEYIETPEIKRIRGVLEQAHWNRKLAARLLKMPYSTLRYKIDKYNIQ